MVQGTEKKGTIAWVGADELGSSFQILDVEEVEEEPRTKPKKKKQLMQNTSQNPPPAISSGGDSRPEIPTDEGVNVKPTQDLSSRRKATANSNSTKLEEKSQPPGGTPVKKENYVEVQFETKNGYG
jgi:hypothetical protein